MHNLSTPYVETLGFCHLCMIKVTGRMWCINCSPIKNYMSNYVFLANVIFVSLLRVSLIKFLIFQDACVTQVINYYLVSGVVRRRPFFVVRYYMNILNFFNETFRFILTKLVCNPISERNTNFEIHGPNFQRIKRLITCNFK